MIARPTTSGAPSRGRILLSRLVSLALVVLASPVRGVEIELGVEFARPGESTDVNVYLRSEGEAVSGFQNDIVFDARAAVEAAGGRPACTVNPAIQRDGSNFAFVSKLCQGEACERMRAVVFSFTTLDPIADGALLYTCRVRVAAAAIEGAYPLFCPAADVEAADGDGNILPTTCREGAIVVREATPFPGETPVYDPNEPRADGLPCESAAQCLSLSCVARVCGDGGSPPTRTPTATVPISPTPTATRSGPAPTATIAPEATRALPTPQAQATNTPLPNDGGCSLAAAEVADTTALLLLGPVAVLLLRRRRCCGRATAFLVSLALFGCGGDDGGGAVVPTPTAALPATATVVATAPPPRPTLSPSPRASEAPLATATATQSVEPTPTNSATAAATATGTALATSTATLPTPTPTATIAGVLADPLSGGATTVFDATRNAFGQPARNLALDLRTDFFVGNAFFNRNWVTAPSSNTGLDGLGPVFNARSCSSCHPHDGRGRPPVGADEAMLSMLIRLSVPGTGVGGAPIDEPSYGGQLGPQSILGVPAEGRAIVRYEEVEGRFDDGESYSLRRPSYEIVDLAFGPFAADVLLSPRVAPVVFGVGLLEAIAATDILADEDSEDGDGDGISGRANVVWDRRSQAPALGRFGWKANVSTVEQQTAGAFLGDIGLTSELFPSEDCPAPQIECAAALDGGTPELDADKVDFVTFYMRHLAVPARRGVSDAVVLRGEYLFGDLGCTGCHRATWTTAADAAPDLAAQTIHPYTDLLLHDMGEGLADGRPDFAASGGEWRTPPLWGIGLVNTVNGHTFFLHDGRARDLNEAILWHGGEGEMARDLYRALPRGDRAALLRFLESL